jgi:hypothetical protein
VAASEEAACGGGAHSEEGQYQAAQVWSRRRTQQGTHACWTAQAEGHGEGYLENCRWTSHQLFELREDMNRLLKHQGLSFNAMHHPPPLFPDFPEYTTSEEEGEKDPGSLIAKDVPAAHSEEDEEDAEPLGAKMARLKKEAAGKKAMGSSSGGRVRRKATAGRPVKRPIDLSSGSGSDLGSDSTVPEAEEDASDFSDEV